MKRLLLVVMIFLIFTSCSRHIINYDIGSFTTDKKIAGNVSIAVDIFRDLRPEEERKGHSGEFLAFASKDDDFIEPPQDSISNLFRKELQKAGFTTLDRKAIKTDYCITGDILHFQTMVKHPGTMVIPYLGTVATLWESDKYTTIVSIKARMMQYQQFGVECSPKILFDREFNISENLRLKTGILNLERLFGRGMDYQFKRLNIALADVLGQIRDEVIKTTK